MKLKPFAVILTSLFVIALFGQVLADDKPCVGDKPCSGCASHAAMDSQKAVQTKCPVMGGDINKAIFADYQGKRIYFCCEPCSEAFQKDPEKYLEKLKKEGVRLEDSPEVKDQKQI